MDAENTSPSWSSATNWTIFDGSLENSVTFESAVSPIEDITTSIRKEPLILRPSSSDSGPCEIKICFGQKYEVRQVYVRSSARVYEIYYAPNMQSSNEYLCTVRCELADTETLLLGTNGEEGELSNGSNKKFNEKSKSDSSISTSEDDWVDVKVPGSSPLKWENSSMSFKSCVNAGRTQQDFYEATAVISDTDPCTSLTLRMLSLQDKGCIYVDEIYVYAEPFDLEESNDQPGCLKNSTGNSLMAMLVPTLLQLSKSHNKQVQAKTTDDRINLQEPQHTRTETTESTCTYNNFDVEEQSNIADQQEMKVPEHSTPKHKEVLEHSVKEKDVSYSRLEQAMDQLVSRVSRIEDFFLRFEERMLKPICNIEERMGRVEQQLEMLTKNSLKSDITSGTRFVAPEFSCMDSACNSFHNDANDYPDRLSNPPDEISSPINGGVEVTSPEFPKAENDELNNDSDCVRDKPKKAMSIEDFPSELSIPREEMSAPINRGLVITAPEFSDIDDDGELYNDSEAVIDFAKDDDKPKKTSSIEDALASALAGLMISTSIHIPQDTQALALQPPDFSNDEDCNEDTVASPMTQCERAIALPLSPGEFSLFTYESREFDECGQQNEGEEGDDQHHVIPSAYNEVEVTGDGKNENSIFKSPASDGTVIPSSQAEVLTYDNCKNIDEGFTKDILENFLDFSRPSPVLDFNASILDVKFNNSQENSLEALLGNTVESRVEKGPPCIEKIDEGVEFDDKANFDLIEGGEEAIDNTTGRDLLADGEDFLSRYFSCSSQDISATNLA